jgi:hypothetical protein
LLLLLLLLRLLLLLLPMMKAHAVDQDLLLEPLLLLLLLLDALCSESSPWQEDIQFSMEAAGHTIAALSIPAAIHGLIQKAS